MRQIDHHTRDYSLYASWVADPVVLLGSYDSYAYLKPKDHKNSKYIDIRMLEKSETKRVMSKCKLFHLLYLKDRTS